MCMFVPSSHSQHYFYNLLYTHIYSSRKLRKLLVRSSIVEPTHRPSWSNHTQLGHCLVPVVLGSFIYYLLCNTLLSKCCISAFSDRGQFSMRQSCVPYNSRRASFTVLQFNLRWYIFTTNHYKSASS